MVPLAPWSSRSSFSRLSMASLQARLALRHAVWLLDNSAQQIAVAMQHSVWKLVLTYAGFRGHPLTPLFIKEDTLGRNTE